MDSHATDQFGNYKAFSINGHAYTPSDIVVALVAVRALSEAVSEAQSQRTRADDADARVQELETALKEAQAAAQRYRRLWQEAADAAQTQHDRANDTEAWERYS